jgi:hypothetical protein
MPDNVELILRLHPMGGDDIALMTMDFTSPEEALERIIRAIDEKRSLLLRRARFERETRESGVVVNLRNVVTARVLEADHAETTTGQYL